MKRLFFPLLILLGLGCAYYNTFFHAQESFQKAEKARISSNNKEGAGKGDYEQAIKKAAMVLAYYPKSRWVDDALMLIGKSYYHLGEYTKAIRKFQELQTNLPKSNYLDDSYYWMGLAYYQLEDYLQAEGSFKKLLAKGKERKLLDEGSYMLGEIGFITKDYGKAIEEFERLVAKGKGEVMAQAQFRIGECWWEIGDYKQALEAFKKVKEMGGDKELSFRAEFKVGECYEELGQSQEALKVFVELSREGRYYCHLPQVRLKIAETKLKLDHPQEAIKEYESITEEFPQTDESAQALYGLGVIYEDELKDLKKAQEFFEKSIKEMPKSDVAQKAQERSADIVKLQEYRDQLSGEEAEKSVKTLFLLAEMYLMELNEPDSALSAYRSVIEHFPETSYAPRSAYAMSWIWEKVKRDSLQAKKAYERIIQDFPQTPYAQKAREWLGLPPLEEREPAKELFIKGEDFLLQGEVDSALTYYAQAAKDYPQSRYAPKALYALGWIYENREDSLRLAKETYQDLIDEYPQSDYTLLAREKLGEKIPQATSAPPETSAQVNPEVTAADSLPWAPPPLKLGELSLPPGTTAPQGTVWVRIRIDQFGDVKEAHLVDSTGSQPLDWAIEDAARQTHFDPALIDRKLFNSWFLYPFEAKPPEK